MAKNGNAKQLEIRLSSLEIKISKNIAYLDRILRHIEGKRRKL